MFYQINFIGAMTCDDDALLKDNAIQKEMKFRIKRVFSSIEALLKNFTETIDMNETVLKCYTCIVACMKDRIMQFIFYLTVF